MNQSDVAEKCDFFCAIAKLHFRLVRLRKLSCAWLNIARRPNDAHAWTQQLQDRG